MRISYQARPIPRLPGPPIIGHLRDFRDDRLNLLLRVARECGDIGQVRLGSRTITLLNSAEYAHAVLVEHAYDFEKTPMTRRNLGAVVGNGLLTSENEFHKRQRKLIAPAFQHRRIAGYAGVMADYAERARSRWDEGAEIDIGREMMRLTLAIAGKTLFDTDVENDAELVGEALTTALHWANRAFTSLLPLPVSWPTPRNRRFRAARERLDRTIFRLIEERRRSGADRGDLLSLLLQARDADDGSFMSDRQVRDEAMTLFLAGHETTANALTWTWYLLAQHPAILARMREELRRVLDGRAPATSDLPSLPYTLQVFKEAIRLYPPAYVISRQAVRPIDLDGYHLPAGALALISPYTMHRRSDYFPDPERFDPDRFTPEAEARLPRHAYMPFGGGPRICIGNQFALMEGHIILAALAQHVDFELVPGQRIEPEPLVTLRPRGAIRMRVRELQP